MSLRYFSSALGVALLIASSALAQPRNFNNPALRPTKVKPIGTFVQAGQDRFQMSTNANQLVMVLVGPNTEVSVVGTAEQDYLKSGVTVEFVAEVDAKHMVKEKISRLLILSPTTEIGLLPPEAATPERKVGKAGAEKGKPDPGIGNQPPVGPRNARGKADAGSQGDDLFNAKPAKAKKNTPQFPGTFTVRGTVKMFKNGAITVAAGRGPTVKADLADSATIDVELADFRAARRDDKVTVNGVSNQANPNMVVAESVQIDLATPLTGAKKHAVRSAKTPPTSKAKKAADSDDPLGGGK